jgi:CRISPR-associated endonuclease/helicase Cas3
VQFVFDETQLLGPGLPTSVQLQALREKLGTAQPCHTMWMSATVDHCTLCIVDLDRELTVVGLGEKDRTGPLRARLAAGRTVARLEISDDPKRYAREVASRAIGVHRAGTRTLVVLNTVERATAVFDALMKERPTADVVLLHSRFRPDDRRAHLARALAEPSSAGTIVVTTQVLEVGVDITSTVTSDELTAAAPESEPPLHPVLRRRDLLDLFDTAPDLSGNDIDVSSFVRDRDNRTVSVAWRLPADTPDAPDAPAATRDELCPALMDEVRKIVGDSYGRGRVLDRTTGQWRPADRDDVRPGAVIVLDAAKGGYLPERGFTPTSTAPVTPIEPASDADAPEAIDEDRASVGFGR